MDLLSLIAISLDFFGKILLGIMALMVHRKVRNEKKIDKKVLRKMKREQGIGFLALIFFVLSYIIEVMLI